MKSCKRLRLSDIVENVFAVFNRSPVRYFRAAALAMYLDLPKQRVKNVVLICSGIGLCQRIPGRGWRWCGGVPYLMDHHDLNFSTTTERLSHDTLKHILEGDLHHLFTINQLLQWFNNENVAKLCEVLTVFAVLGIVKFHKHKWYEVTF